MKFITAVAAFSIAFGFSAFLTRLFVPGNQSHFQTTKNKRSGQEISSLLQEDIENGREREAISQEGASVFEYSEAVNEYVDASEAIEDVNLPPDFRFAWQAHMNAWRRHADFLESNFSRKDFFEKRVFQTYLNQRDEIERTWLNVLDIGRKYGAFIPPNAY